MENVFESLPGGVINCPTNEIHDQLVNALNQHGFRYDTLCIPMDWGYYQEETCIRLYTQSHFWDYISLHEARPIYDVFDASDVLSKIPAEALDQTPKVYVGSMEYPYRGMLMSHMASPDLEVLHKMADDIGVNRKWFQNHKLHPHYDISKSKKNIAIGLGAVLVSDQELIRKCYPRLADFMDGKTDKI